MLLLPAGTVTPHHNHVQLLFFVLFSLFYSVFCLVLYFSVSVLSLSVSSLPLPRPLSLCHISPTRRHTPILHTVTPFYSLFLDTPSFSLFSPFSCSIYSLLVSLYLYLESSSQPLFFSAYSLSLFNMSYYIFHCLFLFYR